MVVLNIGNGLNGASGIFSAPVKGVYYFSFTGVLETGPNIPAGRPLISAGLYVNGHQIGSSIADENPAGGWVVETLTMQSTLQLNVNDEVFVSIGLGINSGQFSLIDNEGHYTHFNGFLLQQTDYRRVGLL